MDSATRLFTLVLIMRFNSFSNKPELPAMRQFLDISPLIHTASDYKCLILWELVPSCIKNSKQLAEAHMADSFQILYCYHPDTSKCPPPLPSNRLSQVECKKPSRLSPMAHIWFREALIKPWLWQILGVQRVKHSCFSWPFPQTRMLTTTASLPQACDRVLCALQTAENT